jgi:putative DNA-invertase from lambdoid prophage Rac
MLSLRGDEMPFASCTDARLIHLLAEEDETSQGHGSQDIQLKTLLDTIESQDTLVVDRLKDLGNDMQAIRATIAQLLKREVRIFVHQLGAVDLNSPAGRLVLDTLDALADIEEDSVSTSAEMAGSRSRRRGAKVTGPQRSKIVTDYSLGESISSLARRYKLPRSAIVKAVSPAQYDEPPLPLAFGD